MPAKVLLLWLVGSAYGCTNLLLSRGSTADGSTVLTYNADDVNLYGSLGHYPAADHAPGSRRHTWDWDAGTYLGSIPEVPHTFNVVGNANEYGLVIAETTFGGLKDLDGHGRGGLIDYGSLIWITLQRARTAREAIATMDALVQAHGYASDGESFSIADGEEVWLLEMIGKGIFGLGAVWVAQKVPEGYVGSTANQARITTFPLDEPSTCLYAPDLIDFAKHVVTPLLHPYPLRVCKPRPTHLSPSLAPPQGLFPPSAPSATFSFSDTFDPLTFSGARHGEARVWALFQALTGGALGDYQVSTS